MVVNLLKENTRKSNTYLKFLIGNVEYKQISLWKDKIEIKSFDQIPNSKEMDVKLEENLHFGELQKWYSFENEITYGK